MSVQRRVNLLSEQRIDVPDLRSIESAVSADFDTLAQSLITGTSQGYIIRGFQILMATAIGGAASSLQVQVDPGAIFHINSDLSGTFYLVAAGTPVQTLNSATNTIVNGAFTPNAINYVSLEYQRLADATTEATTYFWDPVQNTETNKNTPRALVLSYTLNISTSVPANNFLPIATVTTDASNNVTEVTDARWLMFRLGAGGYSPNPFFEYAWPEGRSENASSSTSNAVDPFYGGDKSIGNLKEWMNAIMSSVQEIKGTTYWYSESTSGSLASLREDLGNTLITGKGSIAHGVDPIDGETPTAQGQVNWNEDIYVRIIGSNLAYKILANPTSTDITLADNECAYINLVRNVAITPNLIWTNGSVVVSSVGSVAWTSSLQSGDWVKLSSDTSAGYYEIDTVDSLTQVTLTSVFTETSTGAAGAKSQYAFGSYQASATPSTNRDIQIVDRGSVPQNADVFWFLLRSDNTGAARVYVRFLSSELMNGESEEIGGEVPAEVLLYMGSPSAAAYAPQYVSALDAGSVPEIQDITFGTAAQIANNAYFLISSSGDWRKYYLWFNKDGAGTDPKAPFRNVGIEINISTGQTAAQIAALVSAALIATDDFNVTIQSPTNVIRVTNTSAGVTTVASDFDMGAPFAVTEVQAGTGTGNFIIHDGDNLTLAIKELDQELGNIAVALDTPSYDEEYDVVAPITSGSLITLPVNTRLGSAQQFYSIGKGVLQVYLNGQYLRDGADWLEVGAAGTVSDEINIQRALVVGDILTFRASGVGSGMGGGGGGEQGPPGPTGPAGPPGADAAGGPIAFSTKNASYSITLSDCLLRGNCSSGALVFTLPSAASAQGRIFYVKKIYDGTSNALTIQANGSELIDNSNTLVTTTQGESFTLFSNGSGWDIL